MAGRPDFSQAGSSGSGQTVAVTERPELVSQNADQTTSVAAGSREYTEVYAPAGSIFNINQVKVIVEPDATALSGNHTVGVRPINKSTALHGNAPYSSGLEFTNRYWRRAATDSLPPSAAAQGAAINSLRATETRPLTFVYTNNTDAAQDNARQYQIIAEEVTY